MAIRELEKLRGNKSRRWEIIVYAHPRRISKVFYGTKTAAQDEERDMRARLRRGDLVATEATVGDLMARWLTHLEAQGRSPWTLRGYRSCINRAIVPALGTTRLVKLTAQHLDAFYGHSLLSVSGKTVHQYHAIISAALNQAVKWELVGRNVAKLASPPPIRSSEISLPDPQLVRSIVTEAQKQNPVLAALIILAAVTGARRGELCGLRWSDVQFADQTVRFQRSVFEGYGTWSVKDTKTHQGRLISLDPLAVAVLQTLLTDRLNKGYELSLNRAYIFSPAPDGSEPYRPSSVTHFFESVRGDSTIKLHDLRHFSVSRALAGGVDAVAVAKRHGHKSTRMTLEVYGHALPEGDRAAAAITAQLVLGD